MVDAMTPEEIEQATKLTDEAAECSDWCDQQGNTLITHLQCRKKLIRASDFPTNALFHQIVHNLAESTFSEIYIS